VRIVIKSGTVYDQQQLLKETEGKIGFSPQRAESAMGRDSRREPR
jgi:hypothetical protein